MDWHTIQEYAHRALPLVQTVEAYAWAVALVAIAITAWIQSMKD